MEKTGKVVRDADSLCPEIPWTQRRQNKQTLINDTAPEATRTTDYPSRVLHDDEPNVHKSACVTVSHVFQSCLDLCFCKIRLYCFQLCCCLFLSDPLGKLVLLFSSDLHTIFPPSQSPLYRSDPTGTSAPAHSGKHHLSFVRSVGGFCVVVECGKDEIAERTP